MSNILKAITSLAQKIATASDGSDPFIEMFSESVLVEALESLTFAAQKIAEYQEASKESVVTEDRLEEMAVIASEFDKSGDPILIRQASVLDEILLTIGASKKMVSAAKNSQNKEIEKIRDKKEEEKPDYVIEAQKAIDNIKTYRPLEAPLDTRTCPDHPGAQMARIGDRTYQCSLDKGIYNYAGGFTTMKGNSIPGTDVSNQTHSLTRPNEITSFDTRESRLNG